MKSYQNIPFQIKRLDRQSQICFLRIMNPSLTAIDIAQMAGTTPEVVNYVLKKSNLEPKPLLKYNPRPYPCKNCAIYFEQYSYDIIFCSKECYERFTFTDIYCDNCGRLLKIRKKKILLNPNQRYHYCSLACRREYQKKMGHGYLGVTSKKTWQERLSELEEKEDI